MAKSQTKKDPASDLPKGMPKVYKDRYIEMPSEMITTKEAFAKIWRGKLKKGDDLDSVAEKALVWKAGGWKKESGTQEN